MDAITLGTIAQPTLPVVNACQIDCTAYWPSRNWFWVPYEFTSSVVHATVVYVTNDDDKSVRTTTVYNDLPGGLTAPSTNAAGTQTTRVTIETAQGKFDTVDLAFPTWAGRTDIRYVWKGTLATSNAMGIPTCSTAEDGADPIYFRGYTATVTTGTARSTNQADPGGLQYMLASHACPDGSALETPPPGNANDGAIRYCDKPTGQCAVDAVSTVKLLTETTTSRERRAAASSAKLSTPNVVSAIQATPHTTSPLPVTENRPPPAASETPQETLTTQQTASMPTAQASESPKVPQSFSKMNPEVEQASVGSPVRPTSSDILNDLPTQSVEATSMPNIGDAIASGVGESPAGHSSDEPSATATSGSTQFEGGAPVLPVMSLCVLLSVGLFLQVVCSL